jgi:hypothetical protein
MVESRFALQRKRFFHSRLTAYLHLQNVGQDANCNVVVIEVVAEDIEIPAVPATPAFVVLLTAAAAAATTTSGHQLEFLTEQLYRVGKLFHVVHVTLL